MKLRVALLGAASLRQHDDYSLGMSPEDLVHQTLMSVLEDRTVNVSEGPGTANPLLEEGDEERLPGSIERQFAATVTSSRGFERRR